MTSTTTTRRLALGLAATLLGAAPARAQTDVLQQLNQLTRDSLARSYVPATFKGTRISNGHSIETPGPGSLVFLISHRFGRLNSGAYEFFGLDQATIRLGLEYGLTERLAVGAGRSSLEKTVDGFLKYKLLRQSTGAGAEPVSVTLLATAALTSLRFAPEPARTMASRLTYTYQALIARKLSPELSVQLMPTLLHRNYVERRRDQNNVYALGLAARQKISKHVALTGEYYYLLPGATQDDYRNALALGFDIETGGHVFQLHFTNSQGMIEKFFIPQTQGNFLRGDIYFGFNIARSFQLRAQH